MAAKSGIFDFVFKSGAKAAKEMAKGTKPTQRGVGQMAKSPSSNMKVVPPKTPAGTGGGIAKAKKYYAETGRPKVVNGRPLPPSMMRPIPAKKTAPGPISPETAAKMAKKMSPAKRSPLEMKKPAPAKKAVPVKKAQPGRVSPETARKLAVVKKNDMYDQRRDAVRMLPAKPPVKKFR